MLSIPQNDTDVNVDTITLIVEYEGSGRYLRNEGVIVEVRRNGDPGRPPRNPNLDVAIRWLAENDYQPAGFENLDRPGVDTFRPHRRQTYQRVTHESHQEKPEKPSGR